MTAREMIDQGHLNQRQALRDLNTGDLPSAAMHSRNAAHWFRRAGLADVEMPELAEAVGWPKAHELAHELVREAR